MRFTTEAQVWRYIQPQLRGLWRRIETVNVPGFPDVYGWPDASGTTHFIELKCGAPLDNSQRAWLAAAWQRGVPAWILRGRADRLDWYQDLEMKHPLLTPVFVLPAVPPRTRTRPLTSPT